MFGSTTKPSKNNGLESTRSMYSLASTLPSEFDWTSFKDTEQEKESPSISQCDESEEPTHGLVGEHAEVWVVLDVRDCML